MLEDRPIQRNSTVRFSPTPLFIDRPRDLDTYRCPRCARTISRFQIRRDIHGVPRLVDVTGVLCKDCQEAQDWEEN